MKRSDYYRENMLKQEEMPMNDELKNKIKNIQDRLLQMWRYL